MSSSSSLLDVMFKHGPFYIQAEHGFLNFFFAPAKTTFEYTFTLTTLTDDAIQPKSPKGELQIKQIETNSVKTNKFFIVRVSNKKSLLYFTHINGIELSKGDELICRADRLTKKNEWIIKGVQSPSWDHMRLCWTPLSGMIELGLLSTIFAHDIIIGFKCAKNEAKFCMYLQAFSSEFLSEKKKVLLHAKPVDKPQSPEDDEDNDRNSQDEDEDSESESDE